MSAFGAFLGKERTESLRTWHFPVIVGMFVLFGIVSPVLAQLTPALVSSMAGSQPGVAIVLPPAVAPDAYRQFVKSLDQIVAIALVLAAAGAVAGERRSGTAVLMLTKPLSRAGFVAAKLAWQVLLLAGATVAGTVVCEAVTSLLFTGAALAPLASAVGAWLPFAALLVTVTTFFSVLVPGTGGAAGAGLAFYFLCMLGTIWAPVARYTFAGLPGAAIQLAGRSRVPVLWPVATALAAVCVAAGAAVWAFGRQEL